MTNMVHYKLDAVIYDLDMDKHIIRSSWGTLGLNLFQFTPISGYFGGKRGRFWVGQYGAFRMVLAQSVTGIITGINIAQKSMSSLPLTGVDRVVALDILRSIEHGSKLVVYEFQWMNENDRLSSIGVIVNETAITSPDKTAQSPQISTPSISAKITAEMDKLPDEEINLDDDELTEELLPIDVPEKVEKEVDHEPESTHNEADCEDEQESDESTPIADDEYEPESEAETSNTGEYEIEDDGSNESASDGM